MKKVCKVLLVTLLLLSLVACSSNNGTNSNTEPDNGEETKDDTKTYSTVTFGVWNGEPIVWMVLDEQDGEKLLVSKEVLFEKEYNDEYIDVTWETSTLRSYLNGSFISEAGLDESKIVSKVISNSDNPDYKTAGGNDTIDKVFILSIDEANKYFSNESDRISLYTGYDALEKGNVTDIPQSYWLRSPGFSSSSASWVDLGGYIRTDGNYVNDDFIGVRPALWIKL